MRETAELATMCRVSHRVATAMTAKLVKAGGGQLKNCSISATTSYRQRSEDLKKCAGQIKSDFRGTTPPHIVIHWDGKVTKYENQQETDERLAIVASFPRPINHLQFLAVPCIPDGTGVSMNTALMNTLQSNSTDGQIPYAPGHGWA